MLDKPITIPATSTTKTENDDLSFLDFMPAENSPIANEATDSTKEMLPDILEDRAHDLEQQDVAYAENAREVSDLLFQFLQKETVKEEVPLEQNNTIVSIENDMAKQSNIKTSDNENITQKQVVKQDITTSENDIYTNKQNKANFDKKNSDIKFDVAKTSVTKPLQQQVLTADDALLTVNKNSTEINDELIDKINQIERLASQSPEVKLQTNKKSVVTNKPFTIDISTTTSKSTLNASEQMLVASSVQAQSATQVIDNKLSKAELPPNVVLTVEAKEVRAPHEANVVINTHQIRISVNPPELGPVSASIRYDQNRMVLDIAVKNNDIGEMIKQHLPELRQQLSQLNLNIDNINVQNMDSSEKDSGRGSNQPQTAPEEFMQATQKVAEKRNESTKNKQNTLVDTYI